MQVITLVCLDAAFMVSVGKNVKLVKISGSWGFVELPGRDRAVNCEELLVESEMFGVGTGTVGESMVEP